MANVFNLVDGKVDLGGNYIWKKKPLADGILDRQGVHFDFEKLFWKIRFQRALKEKLQQEILGQVPQTTVATQLLMSRGELMKPKEEKEVAKQLLGKTKSNDRSDTNDQDAMEEASEKGVGIVNIETNTTHLDVSVVVEGKKAAKEAEIIKPQTSSGTKAPASPDKVS